LDPGIVIIAGTGSVAFGIDDRSRRARAGGWGPLLDDEGSGYAIGRATLRAAMRAYDGRGPATTLAEAVQRRFLVDSLGMLKHAVRGMTIDQIAAVAPLALEAARAGDREATAILNRAAEGLADMIAAVARMLGWQHTSHALIATGGVFAGGELILGPMAHALADRGCRSERRQARFPPEVGAALLAARAIGVELEPLIARLPATGDAER
jgi:N-acetylglucosamine kinase-like BadF-type ATPase